MWFLSKISGSETNEYHIRRDLAVEDYSCLVWTSLSSPLEGESRQDDNQQFENVILSATVRHKSKVEPLWILIPLGPEGNVESNNVKTGFVTGRTAFTILEKCQWCFWETVKLSKLAELCNQEEDDDEEDFSDPAFVKRYVINQRSARLKAPLTEPKTVSILSPAQIIDRFNIRNENDICRLKETEYGSKTVFLAFSLEFNDAANVTAGDSADENESEPTRFAFSYSYRIPSGNLMETMVVPVSTPMPACVDIYRKGETERVTVTENPADFFTTAGALHPLTEHMNHKIYSIGAKRSSGLTAAGKSPLEHEKNIKSKRSILSGTHVVAVKPQIKNVSDVFEDVNPMIKEKILEKLGEENTELRMRKIIGPFNTAVDLKLFQEI